MKVIRSWKYTSKDDSIIKLEAWDDGSITVTGLESRTLSITQANRLLDKLSEFVQIAIERAASLGDEYEGA